VPQFCVQGVTPGQCGDGDDVCVWAGTWAPWCQDIPGITCSQAVCGASAQCVLFVGSGAAGVVCFVDGQQVGPIATCDACTVLFYVACSVGTEEVRCWSSPPIDCATAPPLCDPTDPCGWGWFECVPCDCLPVQWAPSLSSDCGSCGVRVCVRGVTDAHCYDGADDNAACVYGFSWTPVCYDWPPCACVPVGARPLP
jgi:hypothetical protein